MNLFVGLVRLATLNTALIAGVLLIIRLPVRPIDWVLMFWPWLLVAGWAGMRERQ